MIRHEANVWHKSQIVQETGSLFRHLTGLFYRIHYAARREHHAGHWPQQGVANWLEHRPVTPEVAGSSPVTLV